MFLRFQNGTKQLIRFDKVAYKNSQYWGFNYITDGEDDISTGIMGTSFFSWRNSSLNASDITRQVGELINATKN